VSESQQFFTRFGVFVCRTKQTKRPFKVAKPRPKARPHIQKTTQKQTDQKQTKNKQKNKNKKQANKLAWARIQESEFLYSSSGAVRKTITGTERK